jgi:hypothetical protein
VASRIVRFVAVAWVLFLIVPALYGVGGLSAAARFSPRLDFATTQSLNWAGYAVTGSGGSVTAVAGSWVQPSVKCGGGTTYAAFWAGIDGFNSNTVEQAGTLAECSRGVASYSAWYEFYPAASVTISGLPVKPGDAISVRVVYAGSSTFEVELSDVSAGHSYSTAGTVSNAARSSAECITERPSIAGSITRLANFGTAEYGEGYTGVAGTRDATVGGTNQALGAYSTVTSITMVSYSGRTLAEPSGLTSSESSFTVTWYRSG